jgi:hypothetical protein
MPEGPRSTMDRIVDPSYLDNLQAMPIDELRRKKDECESIEAEVSYARRLIQGKLDILRHGAERLAGGDKLELNQMVGDLPGILSDGAGGSPGRLPRILASVNLDAQRRDVELVASDADLARLDELSAQEVGDLVNRLATSEKETSQHRRCIQVVMDQLTAELVRRFREGSEDPTALLPS